LKLKLLLEKNIFNLLFKLSFVLLILEVYRILLLFCNGESFPDFGVREHIIGLWFDCITIALFFLPYIFLSLIPLPLITEKIRSIILFIVFTLCSAIVFLFNALDVAYFSYTHKRTSYDYLKFMLNSDESGSLAGDFILEFWWLILFFIVSFGLLLFTYLKSKSVQINYREPKKWMYFLLTIALTIVIGRGGFQLKPIGILESTNYVSIENSPAVLNSAFTLLKTYQFKGVEKKTFFSDAEIKKYFNPIQNGNPQNLVKDSQNVVFILFESFGSMYCGPNNPESFTPFLDSILLKSMYFEHGIANGRTSMDALPAVISSIPMWMNESFILSSYSSNQFQGIPSILKGNGYSSAFFHGATNGSMRFDAFTSAAGFDSYYGRTEYNNEAHFDGNWGIEDHHFLAWSLGQMDKMKKPFFSMVFTLSSHHPFTIPKDYRKKVKKGPEPLCATISYVDIALREFWNKAQKKSWFKNTIFVFCSDHVGPTGRSDRSDLAWLHRVPIAFYHPTVSLPHIDSLVPFQQIDILPTLMDLLNIRSQYYAFGTSYFNKQKQPKIIYAQENLMAYQGTKDLLVWNLSSMKKRNKSDDLEIKKMKAIYQHYTNDLIENKMTP
jgi:phosphoglycerol transferase MdoB-like AlkP superfamily enzyme